MKLYTEEQVRQAYNVGIINGYTKGDEKENKFINSLIPIEQQNQTIQNLQEQINILAK